MLNDVYAPYDYELNKDCRHPSVVKQYVFKCNYTDCVALRQI
jgi:hypothetical protein